LGHNQRSDLADTSVAVEAALWVAGGCWWTEGSRDDDRWTLLAPPLPRDDLHGFLQKIKPKLNSIDHLM
jgi:hypothetical protein